MLQWMMLLTMLLTLPMALLVMELMFYYGTMHIPDDILQQMWENNITYQISRLPV